MEAFEKLGELIEDRWRAENYNEQVFPEIAAQALKESDLPSRIDPWSVIRWVHTTPALPDQKDVEAKFADPPITVFSGPRFYIDVYYWLDGAPDIHQHAFTGAFQVFLGSSIHSRYSFREDRVLNEHFSVGEVKSEEVQLLKLGDVQMIRSGRQYIHSLFHLDRPSASITVRTGRVPSAEPQYAYYRPYLAENPFFRNVVMTKKLQTVGLLLGMQHKDADAMIGDLVCSSDFHTAFRVLGETFRYLKGHQLDRLFGISKRSDRFDALLHRAKSVHGDLVDLIPPVFEELERLRGIVARRSMITGDEHRFFLALLLNVAGRERILQLVKQRFADTDPVEKILDWLEELGHTRVAGSKEPNVLGIEEFGDDYLFACECLLRGLGPEEARAKARSDLGANVTLNIDGLYPRIRELPLFRNLFC